MKIEFEIENREAVLLLDLIKNFMGSTSNPAVLKTLSKVVTEIESDLFIGDRIFIELRQRLQRYKNKNTIQPESNMRVDLGMSNIFITRPGGLEREANALYFGLVNTFKKGTDPNKVKIIPLTSIAKCKKISDVINLIQTQFEKV